MDEKIAITITTMSSSHHVSSAPAAMTTAASDGYCTPYAAFDCEGVAAESVVAAKKAITRDVHITSRRKDIGNGKLWLLRIFDCYKKTHISYAVIMWDNP